MYAIGMIKINPDLEAAARSTAGPLGANELVNRQRLADLDAIHSMPDILLPHHHARLTTAVEASLALRNQFDRQINPNISPLSRPVLKGFAPSQVSSKGYRLSLLNALASVKPIDRALVSNYKQVCLESHLDSLAETVAKLRRISERNTDIINRPAQVSIQQLSQFISQRKATLTTGLDRGTRIMANDLNTRLQTKFQNGDHEEARRCAEELCKSLIISQHFTLRNICAQLPWVMKAVALTNNHAGYTRSCMSTEDLGSIDRNGNSFSGAALLVILTASKGHPFKFQEMEETAKKKQWFDVWEITEYKRGSEERSFVAERSTDKFVSLVNHYPVHPDSEGGYPYEKDILRLLDNLPG